MKWKAITVRLAKSDDKPHINKMNNFQRQWTSQSFKTDKSSAGLVSRDCFLHTETQEFTGELTILIILKVCLIS